METRNPLLIGAFLQNVTIQGDHGEPWDHGAQYFIKIYVADKKVVKSTCLKSRSPVLEWKWDGAGFPIWFEPFSTMKIILCRKSKLKAARFDHVLGQLEGTVLNLLGTGALFDLMDEKGGNVNTQLNICLAPTSESNADIEAFMAKVDADVSRLPSNGSVMSTISTVGQILQITRSIMDKVSQAHPILNASWIVVSSIYKAIQEADIQDESIRDLASTMRQLLGTATAVPNLPEIPNTKNVIESISRQSLQVASLIDEYTKLLRAGRTMKVMVPGDLKSRIAECQKGCAALEKDFFNRVQIDTHIQARQSGRKLAAIVDDQLAGKIKAWLSPLDSSINRNEAHIKRQAGTCSWFLNGDKFLDWKRYPSFIWVHGKPGCGKSILCSSIINDLTAKPATSTVGVGYFLFDGRDGQTNLQLHSKLIRSLLWQLSFGIQGTIPAELVDLYRGCGNGTQQPLDDQLQEILDAILDEFENVYIIIDALDECTDYPRTLAWVCELVARRQERMNLHIAVTSRPEPKIKEVLGELDLQSLDVSEATGNEDIKVYLKSQMESKSKFKKYDEETRNKIEQRLMEGADGSFRWVALQLDELERCSSADEIDKQLAELPKGLDETYNRILTKIDNKYLAHIKTFLEWLAFSLRPMTVNELAETITVDLANASDGGPVFDPRKRYFDPQDVLVRCSSLVSIAKGEEIEVVKLSHFSVKEYLLSDRIRKDFTIDEKSSHSRISETSIVYLMQFNSLEGMTQGSLVTSPLANYAAEYWVHHANQGGVKNTLLKTILEFFNSHTAAFTNWTRIYNVDKPWEFQRPIIDITTAQFSPLYWASFSGWQQVVEHLLKNGANSNMQGGFRGNALQAASYEGHQEIVKLLLEAGEGTEVYIMQEGGICALQAASSRGHLEIVKLLLEAGAEVNMQGRGYGNALQAASSGGHQEIVKLLLGAGAEVNMQSGFRGNALQVASLRGNEDIVKLLLEKGAEVNMQGGRFGNALQAASLPGNKDIVKLLLEKGAEANIQGGEFGTALQAASYGGQVGIMKLLLEAGAEVNVQSGTFGNALQAASYGGHEGIVQFLLEAGAEVNMQGGEFGNALQAASYRGHQDIVKLLLKKKAEANMQGGRYGNALQAASLGGYVEMVKLLLEEGADVNMQGGKFGNALQAASYGGHKGIVQFLLEKGAEANLQGGKYGNALQAASYEGHQDIVTLLLEEGAEVNIHGGKYGYALQAASYGGHKGIVQFLLKKGAEANLQGGKYGNALQAASYGGHQDIVTLLLEEGAEVNIHGGKYGYALQAASYRGHKGIMELLLEQGAEVNMQGGEYGCALQAASSGGHDGITELLIAHGAIEQY